MIDHTPRLTTVVKDELHRLTLGKESVAFGLGLSFGTVPIDQAGQVYIGPMWTLVLTMRNPLLGKDDIGRGLPVFGIVPPDELFRQAVSRLLDELRKEYDEALKVKP